MWWSVKGLMHLYLALCWTLGETATKFIGLASRRSMDSTLYCIEGLIGEGGREKGKKEKRNGRRERD